MQSKIHTLVVLACLAGTVVSLKAFQQSDVSGSRKVTNQVVVVLDDGNRQDRIAAISSSSKALESRQPYEGSTILVLDFPDGTELSEVVKSVRRERNVLSVSVNAPVYLSSIPNDTYFSQQWNMRNLVQGVDIEAPGAWDNTTGSSSVVVALVDTGVDVTHEDLSANIVPGKDVVHDSYNIVDWAVHSHGTANAGIIGAVGNNAQGVAGVAWQTKIMPVTFCDTNLPVEGMNCTDASLAASIEWATNHGAQIISVSSNSPNPLPATRTKIQAAAAAQILVVFSAGNTRGTYSSYGVDIDAQSGGNRYPCEYDEPNMICVAAVSEDGSLPSFSNRGVQSVDLGAPGVDIFSTIKNNAYGYPGPACCNFPDGTGTSYAAPHVSGVAALMKAANPSYQYKELKENLLLAAQPTPTGDLWGKTVTGRMVNADVAVLAFGDSFDDASTAWGENRFFLIARRVSAGASRIPILRPAGQPSAPRDPTNI